MIKKVSHKPRFFLDQGSFPQAKIFPQEYFFLIKGVSHKPIWSVLVNGWVLVFKLSGCGFESHCCHQDFSLIKEAFHKPRFYHKKRFVLGGSFPQAKILPQEKIFLWWTNFSQSPDFSLIDKSSTCQGFSMIKEVFQRPRFFHKQNFYIHLILKILD